MIDNIKFSFPAHFSKEILDRHPGIVKFMGNEYTPIFSQKNDVYAYKATDGNLLIRLVPHDGKVVIENSLHKYYHENNSGDFYLSDIVKVVNYLSNKFKFKSSEAVIKKIEFGVNIQTELVKHVLKGLLTSKQQTYYPMIWKNKEYGKKCEFNQYRLKAYNKAIEVKIHNKVSLPTETIRWEKAVVRMAHLHQRATPIPIYTLADIIDPDKLKYLADDLCNAFKTTVKSALNFEYETLSTHEFGVLAVMQNNEIKAAMKELKGPSFKSYARSYKILSKETISTWQITFDELLRDKCKELLNG
jgi:hypothetical protein